jgi:hypothetical protein
MLKRVPVRWSAAQFRDGQIVFYRSDSLRTYKRLDYTWDVAVEFCNYLNTRT